MAHFGRIVSEGGRLLGHHSDAICFAARYAVATHEKRREGRDARCYYTRTDEHLSRF